MNKQKQNTKNCPYCSEEILATAVKCKHCGSMLNESPTTSGSYDPFTFIKMSLINKYDIVKEIGHGGMASVYKAIQKNLDRTVALKIVHQNLVHDMEFIGRFHREAQLSASLSHPNIVTIYDEGIENGVHYISMEFLDGEDLHNIIKYNGKIEVKETIRIITFIADALNYAHKKNIIHRDIKSSNIILTKDGRAVLTDFGIAHAASGTKLTQTGTVIGTPEYMSPEQAEGKGIDKRSDLYSLGIVMYECLTGTVPFKGDNPITTIHKIIYEDLQYHDLLDNSLPEWLASIVIKAVSKNKDHRFDSGHDFITALRNQTKFKLVTPIITQDNKTRRINKNDIKIKPLVALDKNKAKIENNRLFQPILLKIFNLTNAIIFFGISLTILILYVLIPRLPKEQKDKHPVKIIQTQQTQTPTTSNVNEEKKVQTSINNENNKQLETVFDDKKTTNENSKTEKIKKPKNVKVTVPAIEGLSLTIAKKILSKNNLKAGKISHIVDSKNIGFVIKQFPKAGEKINRNSYINVIIGE